MRIEGKNYKTIWFDKNLKNVKIIDQTKLPHEFKIKELETVKDSINAIKVMEVRGAPLIGATAAFGIVLAIKENNNLNFIKKSAEDLVKARPTAINLQWAVHRMNNKISMIKSEKLFDVALNEAELICDEDEKFSEEIGKNGLKIIEEIYLKKKNDYKYSYPL
jgi:Predicted translation initiation factor 2B subunit, eIF-2B alpha/beta/delta family